MSEQGGIESGLDNVLKHTSPLKTVGPTITEETNRRLAEKDKNPEYARRLAERRAFFFTHPDEAVDMWMQAEENALTDQLTGLGNRRKFEEEGMLALLRAKRRSDKGENPVLSVIMIDGDNLKLVNDAGGRHAKGDDYLRGIGQSLLAGVRETDIVCRLGGDEFGIILDETSSEGATLAISRIEERFNQIRAEKGLPEYTGISAGAVQWDGKEDLLSLVARADEKLYEVKKAKKTNR